MTRPTIHRIRLVQKKRRRLELHLCAIAVVLLSLIPRGQPAQADAISGCFQTISGTVCSYPPPDLLNLNQSLYAATDAQRQSLQNLEATAVSNTLADHGLPANDRNTVQSWGRYDAEAELFSLIEQAIKATSRTPDQQNAVDWVAAVEQREAEVAAQDAGLEYVKWAGLSQNTYQSLVDATASQGDLQNFLSATPEPFNGTGFGDSTRGFCVYRPPTPYTTEYNDSQDSLCYTSGGLGCAFNCAPPTPSYDQFVRWGEADANDASLSSSQSAEVASKIAAGLIFGGVAVGAGVSGVVLSTGLANALIGTTLQQAILPYATTVGDGVAEEVGVDFAAGEIAASAGAIATVLIAAITTAVVEGINVTNAAALPGKLATLIVNVRTTAPDPATLLNDANGTSSLYSLFVGATLPEPSNQSCDTTTAGPVCLNPTPIPPATSGDPTFAIQWNLQASGFANNTTASTITWADAALHTTMTARVSGSWFIVQANGSTAQAQTLSIAYTDWFGDEQVAWLLGNPTDGYQFVGYNTTLGYDATISAGGKNVPLDPATCLAQSVCWKGPSIQYVGSDGTRYQASVHSPSAFTGAPTYSDAVYHAPFTAYEGAPVIFNANGFAPLNASGQIDYTWQFQQTACNIGCFVAGPPDYTAPRDDPGGALSKSGAIFYTWPTSGQYAVRVTATDAAGAQVVDTFTVQVTDIPPHLSSSFNRGLTTWEVGIPLSLNGVVHHSGTQDDEIVNVNWGDGTSEDRWAAGPDALAINSPLVNGAKPPVTLTPDSSKTSVAFSDTHTYAAGGIYYATISVADQAGGTDSQTFKVTIDNVAPTTSSLAPTSAPVGSSPTLTVTGSGFVPGATVALNGSPLATTYISGTEVTAQVPATDTASAAVDTITVVNPAPGGGASSSQILYIVPAQTSITAAKVASSTNANGSATAQIFGGYPTVFGLAATASGAGTVAVAQYSSDPLTTTPPAAVNAYFDVFVPAGSSFSSVQVTDCNLGGGSVVYYYDDTTGQWTKVSGQSYDAGTGCVTFTLDDGSTPSLSHLSGTVFGVQNAPPVVTNPGARSARYGSQVSVPVSVTDEEATDKLTLSASGLPAGLSLHDNGDGSGTISGTVTAPAGPYTATITANDGYSDSTPVTVTFTVTPAPLSITANNKSMTYGGTVPSFDAGYSGLVNGDSSGVVSGLTCGATDGQGHPVSSGTSVGTYRITCSGASPTNYTISYVTGTLTINPAPLTITANTRTMLLHGSVPVFTASYSGFVNGEAATALTTPPTCSTTATSGSPVGSYPITCGGAVDPNYAISYQLGALKVLYKWSGFGQPINDPAAGATTMSVFKAGRTVPVKFQLTDATGAVVQAGSLPTFAVSAPRSCAAGSVDSSGTTTTGDTGTTYRWDSTAQQYVYNYHTSSTLAGQCQTITATLDDGTTQSVQVAYK